MTRKIHFILLFVLILPVMPSWALVLHSEDDQPSVSARPADLVVGQWSTNASCVAVGRDGWGSTSYILTTRHQGGGVGTTVRFGGTGYRVTEQFLTGRVDIQISRIETLDGYDAELPDFVQWYTGTNEKNKPIVIGGFGKGKGIEVNDRNAAYYTWAGSSNDTQRWGTNTVASRPKFTWTSEVLVADFDRARSGDCAIAEYDSGGGWFINDGGIWKVAALSASVEHINRSYFKPPDEMYGIRISSYADWINETVPTSNYSSMQPDYGSVPGEIGAIPEPATLGMLAIGGLAMLRCKKRKAV